MSSMVVGSAYAARKLGMSQEKLFKFADEGEIAVIRHNGEVYITLDAVREFIATHPKGSETFKA